MGDDDIPEEDMADDGAVWVLWGTYERATLLGVQQGLYQVQFEEDDSKRWSTVMELALANHPLADSIALDAGTSVLLPSGSGYALGAAARHKRRVARAGSAARALSPHPPVRRYARQ